MAELHHVGIASRLSAVAVFSLWRRIDRGGFEDTVVSTTVPKVPSVSDAMVSQSDRFPGSRGNSESSVRCENDLRLPQS